MDQANSFKKKREKKMKTLLRKWMENRKKKDRKDYDKRREQRNQFPGELWDDGKSEKWQGTKRY